MKMCQILDKIKQLFNSKSKNNNQITNVKDVEDKVNKCSYSHTRKDI